MVSGLMEVASGASSCLSEEIPASGGNVFQMTTNSRSKFTLLKLRVSMSTDWVYCPLSSHVH